MAYGSDSRVPGKRRSYHRAPLMLRRMTVTEVCEHGHTTTSGNANVGTLHHAAVYCYSTNTPRLPVLLLRIRVSGPRNLDTHKES
jgi:hypothetical protein